jgi:hypothetical protein
MHKELIIVLKFNSFLVWASEARWNEKKACLPGASLSCSGRMSNIIVNDPDVCREGLPNGQDVKDAALHRQERGPNPDSSRFSVLRSKNQSSQSCTKVNARLHSANRCKEGQRKKHAVKQKRSCSRTCASSKNSTVSPNSFDNLQLLFRKPLQHISNLLRTSVVISKQKRFQQAVHLQDRWRHTATLAPC